MSDDFIQIKTLCDEESLLICWDPRISGFVAVHCESCGWLASYSGIAESVDQHIDIDQPGWLGRIRPVRSMPQRRMWCDWKGRKIREMTGQEIIYLMDNKARRT